MKDAILFLGFCIVVLFVITGFMVTTGSIIDYNACLNYSEMTKRDVIYKAVDGCYVKYDDVFIPKGEFDKRIIGVEAMKNGK